MYFPVPVTYITHQLKIAATTPIVKKLSRKLTIVMPATLFIISEQNIHQFITFNFESCCYPKIPQYQRLAHIVYKLYLCCRFIYLYEENANAADTLPTHCRHTADTPPTHRRHTADTLPTHCRHTADRDN